jgi:hypothetical protein
VAELADQLRAVTVEARSPDQQIIIEVRGARAVTVSLRPGAYHRYAEPELAHQLGQLATLAWVRYRRYQSEIIAAALDHPAADDATELGPAGRGFREGIERLVLTGSCRDGCVTARSRALVRTEVAIAPGLLDRCTEAEFLAELHTAAGDLLADYRAQLILLRDEIYDLGLPTWYRRALAPVPTTP